MGRRGIAVGGLTLLAWPSATVALFDGLPLDTIPEFAAFVLLVLALLAPRAHGPPLRVLPSGLRGRRVPRAAVGAAALVIVGAKTFLVFAGQHQGFAACYQPLPVEEPGRCAVVWDNPLRLGDVTRFDPVLAFGAGEGVGPPRGLSDSTWHLGMFNDNRFNFYPWVDGVRVRERLPFQVRWTGRVSGPRTLSVAFVGEAGAAVDGRRLWAGSSYGKVDERTMRIPPGRHDLRIEFAFDDHSVQPWDEALPYASFTLTGEQGLPASTDPPPWWAVMPAALADVLLAGLVLALAVPALIALAPVAGILVAVLLAAAGTRVAPGLALIAPALLAIGLAHRRPPGRGAAAFAGAAIVAAWSLPWPFPMPDPLHAVLLRDAGDDWLTYETHARALLEHASLWGGEDVFVYSPGFRYVLGFVRLLTGDGELLPTLLGYGLLLWGAVYAVAVFLGPRLRRGDALALIAAFVLFGLATAPMIGWVVLLPMSEWPAWVAMLFAVPLLFGELGRRAELAGCALLALAVTVRFEQAPAAAFLIGVLLWQRWRDGERGRRLLAVAALPLAILLLPAVHNLAYGHELALMPRTPNLPVNFPLPPSDLLRLDEPEVRGILASQLAGVVYAMPHGDELWNPEVGRRIRAAQAVWLAAVAVAACRRFREGRWPRSAAVLALPVAYLAPHVFIQVYVYYPRHIVAGCLAMALSAITVWGPGGQAVGREEAPALATTARTAPRGRARAG